MQQLTSIASALVPLAAGNTGGLPQDFWANIASLVVLLILALVAVGLIINLVGSLMEVVVYVAGIALIGGILFLGIDYINVGGAIEALNQIIDVLLGGAGS